MDKQTALQLTARLYGNQVQNTEPAPLDEEWLKTIPSPNANEHHIHITEGNMRAIVCLRTLTWGEALESELYAFRHSRTKNATYFAGLHERKAKLSSAIVWVAEEHQAPVLNSDGDILKRLRFEFAEMIVEAVEQSMSLNVAEANALYTSALKYFKGEAQIGHPVPPIVIEVDFMTKGVVTFSRTEFKMLTSREMESIQLVLAARADALQLHVPVQIQNEASVWNKTNHPNLPPHWNSPKRPR